MRQRSTWLLALAAVAVCCVPRAWEPLKPGEHSRCPFLPLKTCSTTAAALHAEDAGHWGGAERTGQEAQIVGTIHFEKRLCSAPRQDWAYDTCHEVGIPRADLMLGSIRLRIHENCGCSLDGGKHCPGSYARNVVVTGRYLYNDPKVVLMGFGDPPPTHVVEVEQMCAIPSSDLEP